MNNKNPFNDIKCFEIFNNYYLFSVSTQTVFSVKKETWDIIQNIQNKNIQDIESLKIKNQKTYSFIKSLQKALVSQNNTFQKPPTFSYDTAMLSLVHTYRCNLQCKYCFIQDKSNGFDMTVETAIKAIQFFITKIAPNKKAYSIDLTGAGEPLLHNDFLVKVVNYITTLRNSGINITPAFITNGMLLNEDIGNFIVDNKISWALSLDGDKLSSETGRLGIDYNKIVSNYLKVKNKTSWLHFGLRCTYNSENCNFINIFESLYRIGFGYQITMNPARTKEGDFGHINKDNIEEIITNYTKFCYYLIELSLKPDIGRLNSYFSGESYFRKYIIHILTKSKTFYRCSAGIQNFAVNHKGEIFICASMINQKPAILGSIYTGLNTLKQEKIKQNHADNNHICSKCWARYNCSGSCMSESLYVNGRIGEPIPPKCRINKHLIKLAIFFCHQLSIQKPDILRYIEEKFGNN